MHLQMASMTSPVLLLARRVIAALFCLAAAHSATAQVRQEILLTNNWKFTKGDVPNAAQPGFNDAQWQPVSVPHDWAIYGPFDGNNDLQKVKIEQNNEKAATLKGRPHGRAAVHRHGLVPAAGWRVPGFVAGPAGGAAVSMGP